MTETSSIDGLVAAGRLVEAVDLLAARNRENPNEADEVRLLTLRRDAAAVAKGTSRTPWPPVYPDPFPSVKGALPEIEAADLDERLLGGGVLHHGALSVRGLLTPRQVQEVRQAIALAQQPVGDQTSSPAGRWYRPLPKVNRDTRVLRKMVSNQGGTWLADSPAATALVLDQLHDTGVRTAISDYFGCRPLFSLQKSTLRRSPPVFNYAGWHQDGSFLGADARAMNVWVALTPCGGELPTPGLELVPARVSEVLPTDNGPGSAWVADDRVADAAPAPPICPRFEPGDALLFDERFLHRTHLTEGMVDTRDALECWFFAPSHENEKYVQLLA